MKTKLILLLTLTSSFLLSAYGGSATWNLDPVDDDWNTAANWSPATVPNGPSDVATFGASNGPDVRLTNTPATVSEIVFNPGASAVTITATVSVDPLIISGTGVTNNSGIAQNFATVHEIMNQGGGEIVLSRSAKAGTNTVYTIGKDAHFNVGSALTAMYFLDRSNADHASLSVYSSQLVFADGSTAEQATITCGQGIYPGGELWFVDGAVAGEATIMVEGASDADSTQGGTFFDNSGSAGNATFVVEGGTNGGQGGFVSFFGNSTAANANITTHGNGSVFFSSQASGDKVQITLASGGKLDVSGRDIAKGLQIGSLAGDGEVLLGRKQLALSIGANNHSTKFDGPISGTGSIAKIGRGRLQLTAANTYTGGTTIERGALSIDNTTDSGCGTGPVTVAGGTLSGTGTIAGAVTVGTGTGSGAGFAPGSAKVPPLPLTIQSTLLLNADSTLRLQVNSNTGGAGGAVANGVTISSGAVLSASDSGTVVLPAGTVFVVLNNTAATPISGTFSNLPDGGSLAVGSNTFQANYEGGDGNDLTLTVVP